MFINILKYKIELFYLQFNIQMVDFLVILESSKTGFQHELMLMLPGENGLQKRKYIQPKTPLPIKYYYKYLLAFVTVLN